MSYSGGVDVEGLGEGVRETGKRTEEESFANCSLVFVYWV